MASVAVNRVLVLMMRFDYGPEVRLAASGHEVWHVLPMYELGLVADPLDGMVLNIEH